MNALAQLAGSVEGTALLRDEGVFLDRSSYVESLRPPESDSLACRLDVGGDGGRAPIVYMGQQLCVDYGPSVVAKLIALSQLQADYDLHGVALWVDTDRAGSEKRMTSIAWPRPAGREGVSLAPPGSKHCEPRFIRIEQRSLMRACDRLRTFLGESGAGARSLERYGHLRRIIASSPARTLADLSARLTDFVLAENGIRPAHVRLSRLLEGSGVAGRVEGCLNALPRVIEVFNRALGDLRGAGVDPLLHPLADDYLPLRVACEADHTRLPLRRRDGVDGTWAVARCRCGASYRFRLGGDVLSIGEITRTGRWSPDVLLPVFLNDLASGVVGGQSSAVYGMVLNRVLREALGEEPIPMLVPESLVSEDGVATEPVGESLVVSYLLDG
ncbi:MAG TPA: hypothetical protein VGJ61_10395 [Solirubrobacterales bacterium]